MTCTVGPTTLRDMWCAESIDIKLMNFSSSDEEEFGGRNNSSRSCYQLGVIQNCHHFQESTQSTLGVKGCRTLFKMLILMLCIFIPGSSKSTFPKYSFGREGGMGSQK